MLGGEDSFVGLDCAVAGDGGGDALSRAFLQSAYWEVSRHLIAARHEVHVVTGAPDFVFTSEIQSANLHIRKGPEIRTGFLKDGKPVQLKEGQEITISTDYSLKGDENLITMSYKKLPVDLKPGNTILCVDGTITLTVLSCDPASGTVRCRCENTADPTISHCESCMPVLYVGF